MNERDRLAAILFAAYENNGHDWDWLLNQAERESFDGEKWPEWEIRQWREIADAVLTDGYRYSAEADT